MISNPSWQALRDLWQHYRDVFRAAWALRDELSPQAKRTLETQFLPAALEIQATPPSPLPRFTAWLLVCFGIIALLWAIFGQIDIVATAAGKVIPSDRSKVIQPVDTATVKRILVQDGQEVRKGQVLMELDATGTGAERAKILLAWQAAVLDVARYQAVLHAIAQRAAVVKLALRQETMPLATAGPAAGDASDGTNRLTLAPSGGTMPPEKGDTLSHVAYPLNHQALHQDVRKTTALAQQLYDEHRAKLAVLDAESRKRSAERDATREIIAKLQQTLPIARQRAEDFKSLHEKNFMSKHGYMEREQARIEQERDLAAQRSKFRELQAALDENAEQRTLLMAEFRRTLLDKLAEAEKSAATLEQEFLKAEQRDKLMTLRAPVDGVVQQLAVHTMGGVVTPAQPIMIVVPKDNPMEVEAWVENKDIGFVRARQKAEIKIETFQYTKYGTLSGTVNSVSSDAVSDEKRGLIYQTRVALHQSTLDVDGKQVRLSPGMAVSVEIKTGKRRVIEYFLSPLIQHAHESLRER